MLFICHCEKVIQVYPRGGGDGNPDTITHLTLCNVHAHSTWYCHVASLPAMSKDAKVYTLHFIRHIHKISLDLELFRNQIPKIPDPFFFRIIVPGVYKINSDFLDLPHHLFT